MKLILINGQGGSGKTTVGQKLLRVLGNSAFIDGDSLVVTNPWEFGGATDTLAIKNTISLMHNFSEAGFQNIIISGLTRNQELLDVFLANLGAKPEVLFVWLKAAKEVRRLRKENRSRDEADTRAYFDVVDTMYPDINSINVSSGKSVFIDTSNKNVEEIIKEINAYIKIS